MSDPKNGFDGAASDALWDTILMYEQILEHAPEDIEALTELFKTCLAVDEKARAYGYGKRLGQQALIAGDSQRACVVRDLLLPHSDEDPAIKEVVAALAAATNGVGGTVPAAVATVPQQERQPAPTPVETVAQSGASPATADTGTAEMIALVTKILEDMPDDRESLEVLATAYLKAGDGVQAANTFARLADVLIRDQDYEEGRAVQEKLDQLKRVVPEAEQAAERLAQFLSRAQAAETELAATQTKKTKAVVPPPPSLVIDAARRRVVLSDEMELLWDLKQLGSISELQYASVIHDLTELTSSDTVTTVSALHGLWFRSFAGLEALVVQLAAKATMPVITLGGFDLQPAAFKPLSLEYLTFQGVIPFERMGGEALVAVLNPFSQRLQTEVAAAIDCPCHFYLIPPADFDTALEVIKTRHTADMPKV